MGKIQEKIEKCNWNDEESLEEWTIVNNFQIIETYRWQASQVDYMEEY